MKIATCQLPEVFKNTPRALSLLRRYAIAAQNQGVELICFPECFLSGYQVDSVLADQYAISIDSAEFQQLLNAIGDLKVAVIVGFMERSQDLLYNSAAYIVDGKLRGLHRKNHLLGVEKNLFTAGDQCEVFEFQGLRFGINICNDLNDNKLAQHLASSGATALFCPTNNMLPRQIAVQWKNLHRPIRCQRAQSNNLWIITADVTGLRAGNISYGTSSIIDSTGQINQSPPSFSTGVHTADIDFKFNG